MDTPHPQLRPRLLLTAALVTLGLAAQAGPIALLKNNTTSTTILSDSFENYTVTVSPTALNFPTTAGLLTGTSWITGTSYGSGYLNGVANTTRSVSGTVPAFEGNKFLMMSGPTTSGRTQTAWGIADNSGNGNVIEANVAFYNAASSAGGMIYLYGGTAQTPTLLAAFIINGTYGATPEKYTDNTLLYFNNTTLTQSGLGFNPVAWNTLKVVHMNGTSVWDVSINGGTAVQLNGYGATGGNSGNLNAMYFNSATAGADGGASTVYFDAVPEPATLAGLLLGGAGLLAGARRKRQ